jgi:hypothetical protein
MSGGALLGKGPSTLGSVAKRTLGPLQNITKKAATAAAAVPGPLMPKNALNLLKSKMGQGQGQGLSVSPVYGKNSGASRRSSPPKEAPPISPRPFTEPSAPSASASPPPSDPSRLSPPQTKRGISFGPNVSNTNKNTRGKVSGMPILNNSNNNNITVKNKLLQLARLNPNYTRNTLRKARTEYAALKEAFGDKWNTAQVAINSNPTISANFAKYVQTRDAELSELKKNYYPRPIPRNIYNTYAIPDKLFKNIVKAVTAPATASSNN